MKKGPGGGSNGALHGWVANMKSEKEVKRARNKLDHAEQTLRKTRDTVLLRRRELEKALANQRTQ